MIAQAYSYGPFPSYPQMNSYPSPMLPMPTCADPYQSFSNAMNLMQNLQMAGFMQGYLDGLAARSQMDPYRGFPPKRLRSRGCRDFLGAIDWSSR